MHHPLDQTTVLARVVRTILNVGRQTIERLGNLEGKRAFADRSRPGDEIGMRETSRMQRAVQPGQRVAVTDQAHIPVNAGRLRLRRYRRRVS